MTCHCWRIVGEHLICKACGGADIWLASAYKQPERTLDTAPLPINLDDDWWRFLDRGKKILSEVTP
jgi:hypothetical protein